MEDAFDFINVLVMNAALSYFEVGGYVLFMVVSSLYDVLS